MATEREPSATHVLKTNPRFFGQAWAGWKPYEVRVNDRGFQLGDTVLLVEYDPSAVCECISRHHSNRSFCSRYSGRWIAATVGFVFPLQDTDPGQPPRVVFGLLDRERSDGNLVQDGDADSPADPPVHGPIPRHVPSTTYQPSREPSPVSRPAAPASHAESASRSPRIRWDRLREYAHGVTGGLFRWPSR